MTVCSAEPFPHWVIDNFLPEEMARAARKEFDYTVTYTREGEYVPCQEWITREHLYCHLKRTRVRPVPPAVEQALSRMESPSMCAYMSALCGFDRLYPDYERFGGGQHIITAPGGYLGVHADFTHHPKSGMRRALNVLLYLNEDWKPGDGGELELWDSEMKAARVTIAPLFNRAVIFKTSPTSFHGHPEPTRRGVRRSLAVYYYVPSVMQQPKPASEYAWIGGGVLKTTDYRPRPWEYKLRLRRWLSRRLKG